MEKKQIGVQLQINQVFKVPSLNFSNLLFTILKYIFCVWFAT